LQDQLKFSAERRDGHVAVVCVGWDRAGNPVDFELDAPSFRANTARQHDWATRVEAINDIMQAYIRIGVSPDRAWELVEHVLPGDMFIGTEWRSTPVIQGVAHHGDELLEGSDDVGRQSSDGDH
jgi:hypothetical protein